MQQEFIMKDEITAAQEIVKTVIEFFVNYSFQVVGAIIVLIVGLIAAKFAGDLFLAVLKKKNVDITLSKFLSNALRIIIFAFAFIIALGKFGITIAPFIAAFSALAFGASFAVQGPLSNYGAGITIILNRPFKVGDTITIAGISGVVEDVRLASTHLFTEDGVKIVIPNKDIVGQTVQNSGKNSVVAGVVGISYESNPETAVSAIKQALSRFSEVATDPPPQIGIREFADSSINIEYRYWVPTINYIASSHKTNLAIYQALENAKIKIPFPQRDVHIVSQPANKM